MGTPALNLEKYCKYIIFVDYKDVISYFFAIFTRVKKISH